MASVNIQCSHCDSPNKISNVALTESVKCQRCDKTLTKGQVLTLLPHNFAPLTMTDLPLVVFVSGPNCHICKSFTRILSSYAKANANKYLFGEAYLPKNKPLANKLKIRGVPAIAIYRKGKLRGVLNGGARAKELTQFINDSLS